MKAQSPARGEANVTAHSFWDDLTVVQHGSSPTPEFAEWTNTDIWFGNYVEQLESRKQQKSASPPETEVDDSYIQPDRLPKKLLPRWMTMTAAQRENNKRLQREYRERKKARLRQAEAIIGSKDQLNGLDTLKADAATLEAQNNELQSTIAAREQELQQIRSEVLRGRTAEAAFCASHQPSCLMELFARPPDRARALEQTMHSFITKMDQLGQFLAKNSIQPNSESLDEHTIEQLQQQCKAIMQACMQCLNLTGPDLERLIQTVTQRIHQTGPAAEKAARIVAKLELSRTQTEAVLNLREQILDQLNNIYAERQQKNLTVLALLGPSAMIPQQTALGPASEKHSTTDYGALLRQELNALQNNLAEEQKLESEQHFVLFREILSPSQGAWMICDSSPDHCNLLGFMEAVRASSEAQA